MQTFGGTFLDPGSIPSVMRSAWLLMQSLGAGQVSERSERTHAEDHPHLLNRTQIFVGSFLDLGSIPFCDAFLHGC